MEKQKKVYYSREHTKEEKRKQNKAWKKRQRELKRAATDHEASLTGGNHVIVTKQDGFAEQTVTDVCQQESQIPQNGNQSKPANIIKVADNHTLAKPRGESRGALMLRLAHGEAQSCCTRQRPRLITPNDQTKFKGTKEKPVLKQQRKPELKELNPVNIEYLTHVPFASGSYGQCYRARYRDIDVVVKQMIMRHKDSEADKSKARRDLIHEAEILTALGDYESLPMIIGVVTVKEPLCLVTQLHSVNGICVTLHQAAHQGMITASECADIFVKISSALQYVHSRGILHNDIKANNVVLERRTGSLKYSPILIDFGKGRRVSAYLPLHASKKMRLAHSKSYLAPEVITEKKYSTASDIYSLGRMLKAVSKNLNFYHKVRDLVKLATKEEPTSRINLNQFSHEIGAIRF